VDGNSGVESSELLSTLARERHVRVVKRAPAGIYDAMNYGWRVSGGTWSWFVNAGDVFLTTTSVSQAQNLIAANPESSIIGTTVVYLWPTGRLFSLAEPELPNPSNSWRGNFHHQGALIRRSALLSVGGFRTDLELASDGHLIDTVASRFPTSVNQIPLVGFFVGGASTVRNAKALKEANLFRPGFYSLAKRVELWTKNLALRILLRLSKDRRTAPIADMYVLRRERRLLGNAATRGIRLPNGGLAT
jgi:hypothetical protein